MILAVTRFRTKGILSTFRFFRWAGKAHRQVSVAPGVLATRVRFRFPREFWTMSLWESQEAMRAYVWSGDHKAAIAATPQMLREAHSLHLEGRDVLPTWAEAKAMIEADPRSDKTARYTGQVPPES